MDLTEELVSCSVRLETDTGVGTGFFYKMRNKKSGEIRPTIVTNKHVLEGASTLNVHLRYTDGNEVVSHALQITNLGDKVIFHPNSYIDLAVLPLQNLLKPVESLSPLISYISEESIPTDEEIKKMKAIEDVVVVGYPNGLWDYVNMRPLVRRGITASDYKLNYQNNPIFIIDCAIFPGSSGSPVFLYDKGTQFSGNDVILGGLKVKFLGINSKVFIQRLEGDIIEKQIPTTFGTVSMLPIGLGIIIKANQLKVFEDLLPD